MYFTFTGNDASCAAASKVLEILESEQLVERSRTMGEVLGSRLSGALDGQRYVRDIRGRGLFYGVEIGANRDAVVMAAIEAQAVGVPGRLRSGAERAIMVAPPFVVSEAEIDQLVDVLRASLGAVG
ncbi:MAG: aminotransferase class III-fold pyridoxal phosphate-dependent enzyme [Ilumatobacteraceae bacterium]